MDEDGHISEFECEIDLLCTRNYPDISCAVNVHIFRAIHTAIYCIRNCSVETLIPNEVEKLNVNAYFGT
jgi:hypothetical protein